MLQELKEQIEQTQLEILETREALKQPLTASTQKQLLNDIEVRSKLLKILLKIISLFALEWVEEFLSKKKDNLEDKEFSI